MKKTISAGLSVIILTLAFVSLLVAKEQGKEPKDIILDTIEESLRVLKDPSMRGKENISKCRETLWTFLEPIFDLEAISKRALGRAWLKCSVEQRKEFTKVFAEILKDVYLDKSVCCGGEKIVLVRENKQEKRSKVETNFITKENEEISVDFSM